MEKKLVKIKHLLPYIILLLPIALPWFLRSGYLFFTDLHWGPKVVLPDWTSGGFCLLLIIKIMSWVIPPPFLEKLYIVVALAAVLFGGYKIAQNFTKNRAILFLGSAFVLYSPFIYDRLMYGQVSVILAFGLFLGAIGYLLACYLKPVDKNTLLFFAFCAGFSISFSAHFSFFFGLFYIIFGGFILLSNLKDKKRFFAATLYFCLSILIILTINFNLIWGILLDDSSPLSLAQNDVSAKDFQAFKTSGKTSLAAIENVFLMSGFWGAEQFRYEPLQNIKENWGRSFYFLLPIIILGLVCSLKDKKKRKLNIGLIIAYIIAFVLALGMALPLTSKITLWLFNNLPLYGGLRESQKWVAVIAVVYEVLLVCGLVGLSKKKIIIENKHLAVILVGFVILLQAPLMIWGGAGQVKPVDYPQDWYEINNFIIKEANCKTKILFLPWHLYMSFNWIGKIVANPAVNFFKCPVIYGKNMEFAGIFGHSADPNEREVEKWALNVGRTNLLEENKLDIGYIILAKEVDWQNYLWLGNHPNVEFLEETENLIVYKIKRYEAPKN